MERLTDRKRAAILKEIIDRMEAGGYEVAEENKIYVKLAEYENAEEDEEGAVWTPLMGEFVCSNCGGDAPMNVYRVHRVLTKYCPHCGAKMNMEDEDNA
jgi:hypothetical protein